MTTRITLVRTGLLQEVRFKLENDRVAQEINETLSMSINISGIEGLFNESTIFLLTMNVTIVDADGELLGSLL